MVKSSGGFASVCVYNNILRITTCFYKNSTFQVVCLRQSCWSYVAPSSMLSVYYDKICIKFASHHLLLYVVNILYIYNIYVPKIIDILPMHSNVTSKNVSGFTLAGPPCIWTLHYNPTSKLQQGATRQRRYQIMSNVQSSQTTANLPESLGCRD